MPNKKKKPTRPPKKLVTKGRTKTKDTPRVSKYKSKKAGVKEKQVQRPYSSTYKKKTATSKTKTKSRYKKRTGVVRTKTKAKSKRRKG